MKRAAIPRSDLGELDVLVVFLAPCKEAMDPAGVGEPGVGVADPGGEELGGPRSAPPGPKVVDQKTCEVQGAMVFVGVLGASN